LIEAIGQGEMETHLEESNDLRSLNRTSWFAGLTSLAFILLQSACAAVLAVSGLRLVIGLTSLAAASIIPGFIFSIHAARIRVPMMIVAVLGSAINLYVLWRLRSLRSRPAAQWRVKPVTARQQRSEWIQIALAVITLLLIALESLLHHHWHGSY
jgi:cytochrome b subunit of formate dehydrogenase